MKTFNLMPFDEKRLLGVGIRYRLGEDWREKLPEIVEEGDRVSLYLARESHLPFTIVVMAEDGTELASICKEQRGLVKDYLDEDGTAEAVFTGVDNSKLLLSLEGEKICCQKYYDEWMEDLPEELKRQSLSKRRGELSRLFMMLCKRVGRKSLEEMEPREMEKTLGLAGKILSHYRPSTCGEEHNWILGINRMLKHLLKQLEGREDYAVAMEMVGDLRERIYPMLSPASEKQQVEEMFAEDWREAELLAEETNLIPWYLGSRESELKSIDNAKDFWMAEKRRMAGFLERALWKSVRRYKKSRGWKMGELIFYADINQTEHVMVMSLLMLMDEVEKQLNLLKEAEKAAEAPENEPMESGEEEVKEAEKEEALEEKELTDEQLGKAAKKVQRFFWAKSSWAVIYCVCRDLYGVSNASKFEEKIQHLHEKYKFDYVCPDGTVNRSMCNNPYQKKRITKWDAQKSFPRALLLKDTFISALEEKG